MTLGYIALQLGLQICSFQFSKRSNNTNTPLCQHSARHTTPVHKPLVRMSVRSGFGCFFFAPWGIVRQ